ncbi:helix-turn-helix domain-containing protein [Roseicella frigidaeris]|uniref:HTH DNA binding domain-containing protein n=1 Tax=Roseicella frigidaeris TaxID=2230885 RepID=A0A327LWU1_9PROT|nr:helix-turn-helix domain-containing protein [Roseicella frigidaeris]RAI54664.1 hypothetical protein DOO78_25465 [Roseicella frigidaeris]
MMGREAEEPTEGTEAEGQEPWRPVWEDAAAEAMAMAPPSWLAPSRRWPEPDWRALTAPLAAAEDALSRLDAGAEAASPALREGLVARMAFAEAAGWLASAADRAWIHPRDLALAEAGLLGDFIAAALGGHARTALPATAGASGPGHAGALLAAEADRLPDGAVLAQGLALARTLRRLARLTQRDPLTDPAALLQPLAMEAGPLRLRPERLAAWRGAALDPAQPPLLAAAMAAAAWMTANAIEDEQPMPVQALLLAAAVARRRGRLRAIPLPFWAMTGPGRAAALPLRDPAVWPAVFLDRVALAARQGLAELARLREAEAAARQSVGMGRRGHLAAAAELVLRRPVVTARGLARQLGITPQAALRLLKRLEAARVIRESTGRRSFRAYGIF